MSICFANLKRDWEFKLGNLSNSQIEIERCIILKSALER